MTSGNQHSENNEQKKKLQLKQKTNKNKNVKNCTMHGECFKAVYPGLQWTELEGAAAVMIG